MMNILHYFLGFPPLLHSGGLMVYVKDLAKEQLKMGHNVFMIMPGFYVKYIAKSFIVFYEKYENLPVYQIINPQPVTFSGTKEPEKLMEDKKINSYRNFLIKNNIEILHVHSLIGFPKELLETAKDLNIKTVFTTHDYFGLCPTVNLFKYTNEICDDYNEGGECILCNYNAPSIYAVKKGRNRDIFFAKCYKCYILIKKIYGFFKMRKNAYAAVTEKPFCKNVTVDKKKAVQFERLRNYYKKIIQDFDVVIFNSSITENEYKKYINFNNKTFKVIHITHSKIKDNRNLIRYKPLIKNKIQFLFMGYLNKKKGFFDLVDVLNEIKEKYSNWQLNIYGDCNDINLEDFDKNFFKFYGSYNYNDLSNIFSNSSAVIIPSKCRETFGFIGLEAYSYGIPAIVSENVGFGDLITNNKNGIIYKEDKENEHLKEVLINILENPDILKKFNNEIIRDKFEYTLDLHVKEIINQYK